MIELVGTEAHTIEVSGSVAPEAVRVPAGLSPRMLDDGVEVGLLCCAMRGLGLRRPLRLGPSFDYGEALWRVGVVWAGRPAWLAIACDIDRALARRLAAIMVRYPVRSATIVVAADRVRLDRGDRHLEICAHIGPETPEPEPPRPLLVLRGGALFTIPWREDPAPIRRVASLQIVDGGLGQATLGATPRWHATGLVHAGRTHRCGIATRV